MRAHRSLILVLTLAILGAVLAGPAAASTKKERRLIIGGSTSVLPLMQKLASAYHGAFRNIQAPQVGGGQSDVGITGVAQGRFDIGDSSRDPIPGVDPKGLIFTKLAQDGICVITNANNPLTTLSQENIQKIFTGSIRDWREVPGAGITGPIDLFDRDGASGTQDAFTHIFLGEELHVSPSATTKTSNGLEQNAVKTDKQAIGFVSLYYTEGVHAVDYAGIPCTLRNAKSGQYGGVRNFWMVTKGAPKGGAAKFINWVTKPGNKTVRSIINSSWIAIH